MKKYYKRSPKNRDKWFENYKNDIKVGDEYIVDYGDLGSFSNVYRYYVSLGNGYAPIGMTDHEFDNNIKPNIVTIIPESVKSKDADKKLEELKKAMDKVKKSGFENESLSKIRKFLNEMSKNQFETSEKLDNFIDYLEEDLYRDHDKDYEFNIGDQVFKYKGDYNLEGTVVGRFKMLNGAVRYVIEHQAVPKGSFCHIYSSAQLEPVKRNT